MSDAPHAQPPAAADADRLARLEERLARLEAHLGITSVPTPATDAVAFTPEPLPASAVTARSEDELEFEVGQNWFAAAGIVALTAGAGFLLSLPFASLPAAVPALAGGVIAAGLFFAAHLGRKTFGPVASQLRGAGMTLLCVATLRLFFPTACSVFATGSLAGLALLASMVAFNFAFALRHRSAWLVGLALVTGCAAVLAAGTAWFALGGLVALVAATMIASHRGNWPGLAVVAIPLVYATYALWALGIPLRSGVHWITTPTVAPEILLVCASASAAALCLRPTDERDGAHAGISALLTCALGYGLFLVHTVVAFPADVTAHHATACAVFLGLAIAFWRQRQSRVSTFFYAMTGYAALSVAILKAAPVPAVFVWLSVQSVVVVATAIWFRSRFIVVANFLIYAGIVLTYIVVAQRETGISLGFGLVALVSARILNWQQDRLELKTTLMRNAYLVGAWLVFPYALYHLVSGSYVGLAWVGLALGYYALNGLVQNQKYRWMGHATLLLTAIYLVVVGTSRFEPLYRVLSFLVLGTVLMIVSFVFTRLRKRQGGDAPSGERLTQL